MSNNKQKDPLTPMGKGIHSQEYIDALLQLYDKNVTDEEIRMKLDEISTNNGPIGQEEIDIIIASLNNPDKKESKTK